MRRRAPNVVEEFARRYLSCLPKSVGVCVCARAQLMNHISIFLMPTA